MSWNNSSSSGEQFSVTSTVPRKLIARSASGTVVSSSRENHFEISQPYFPIVRESCGERDAATACWTENRWTKRFGSPVCVTSGSIMSWITSGSNCAARSGYVTHRSSLERSSSGGATFHETRSHGARARTQLWRTFAHRKTPYVGRRPVYLEITSTRYCNDAHFLHVGDESRVSLDQCADLISITICIDIASPFEIINFEYERFVASHFRI